MGTGQPALLYIVPLTLGTAVIVGWQRKELRQLWTGEPVSDDWLSVFTSCFAQLRDFPRIAVFLYDHWTLPNMQYLSPVSYRNWQIVCLPNRQAIFHISSVLAIFPVRARVTVLYFTAQSCLQNVPYLSSYYNTEFCKIPRKCRNSVETGKFRSLAKNSTFRGKLWSLHMDTRTRTHVSVNEASYQAGPDHQKQTFTNRLTMRYRPGGFPVAQPSVSKCC